MQRTAVGWLLPALAIAGCIGTAAAQSAGEAMAQAPPTLLERVNHHRGMAGLPPVSDDPRVAAAAQSHAQYMADTGQLSHVQMDRTSSHFSGSTLEDRLRKAGVQFARSGEAVGLASQSSPETVVDDLITTVYHRLLLLSRGFDRAGAGVARGAQSGIDAVYVAIDFTGEKSVEGGVDATVYPIAGQAEVGVDFDPATETPNPLPEHELAGQPVTIQVGGNRRLVIERFTLTPEGGAAPVEARVLTQSDDLQMPEWAAALVPLQPLAPGTAYRAEFVGSVAGVPLTQRWRFTTAASRAVRMSFAQAVVPAGGTQVIRLRNLDRTSSYYLCYEPAELVRATRQQAFGRFAMTVNRCPPGGRCVVNVVAARDEACADPLARGSFGVGG